VVPTVALKNQSIRGWGENGARHTPSVKKESNIDRQERSIDRGGVASWHYCRKWAGPPGISVIGGYYVVNIREIV